jgi:hypothetical protein
LRFLLSEFFSLFALANSYLVASPEEMLLVLLLYADRHQASIADFLGLLS